MFHAILRVIFGNDLEGNCDHTYLCDRFLNEG
jgi:hypothetical protein